MKNEWNSFLLITAMNKKVQSLVAATVRENPNASNLLMMSDITCWQSILEHQ